MFSALVLGWAFVVATPGELDAKAGDRAVYETAKVQAGRDAEAHVRLALWCESHALGAERIKHLALAVLIDPKNARARALMGLVAQRGQWVTPEKAAEKLTRDEALSAKLAAYNAKREQLKSQIVPGPYSSKSRAARAHVELGMWCEKNGLKAEATAHFTSAVILAPYRDTTWRHLGYVKHRGRWMSPEAVAAEKVEAKAQKDADAHWGPKFFQLKQDLASGDRQAAEKTIAEVTDPRAVPAIVGIFGSPKDGNQRLLVRLLGQIDSPASTFELAVMAVRTDSETVTADAIKVLKNRSSRDYAPMLVENIHDQRTYEVVPVRGPGLPGALQVESPRVKWLRSYDAPVAFQLSSSFYGFVGYDENGLPAVARGVELRRFAKEGMLDRAHDLAMFEERAATLIAQAQFKAVEAQNRLLADIRDIEEFNFRALELNPRITKVLQGAAGAPSVDKLPMPVASPNIAGNDSKDSDGDRGRTEANPTAPDPGNIEDRWKNWWYDQLGYRYEPAPQVTAVSSGYQSSAPTIMSCFAAGTPVRTFAGLKPIEALLPGDRVLSQDVSTGELSFETITYIHHNPPAKILRVALDNGETIAASIYHRFWRAGQGWAQARHLKEGDALRSLGGIARVVSISDCGSVPVFNLDVARSRTYFVGTHDVLVHDNTLPEARIKPFDAAPRLVAGASR